MLFVGWGEVYSCSHVVAVVVGAGAMRVFFVFVFVFEYMLSSHLARTIAALYKAYVIENRQGMRTQWTTKIETEQIQIFEYSVW